MNTSISSHVLVIDDGQHHCINIIKDLIQQGYTVHVVYSYEESYCILNTMPVETILLPINNNNDVFSFFDILITDQEFKYIPIVALLEIEQTSDVFFIEKLLQSGIADYLILPCVTSLLLHRIKHVVNIKQKNIHLRELATKDDLTWLVNRKTFCKQSKLLVSQQIPVDHKKSAVLLFNIVNFKNINEQYGHKTGDNILAIVASLLTRKFDESTIIARLYSDTFAVCAPSCDVDKIISTAKGFIESAESHAFPVEDFSNTFTSIVIKGGISFYYNNCIASMINDVELTMAQIKDNSDEKFVQYMTKKSIGISDTSSTLDQEAIQNKLLHQSIKQINILPGINITEGLSNVLNDEALFYDVLTMFFQEHGQDGQKFKSAFMNNDIETLKHLAHTLKGVSASIAAVELHNKTKLLDDLINFGNKDQQNLSLYLENTHQELTLVLEGIQAALNHKPSLIN